MYLCLGQNVEANLLGRRLHHVLDSGNKRFETYRLRVDAQKQMLHSGIAGGYDFIHLVRRHLPFYQESGDEVVQRAEDDLVQLGQAVLVEHGVADAGD